MASVSHYRRPAAPFAADAACRAQPYSKRCWVVRCFRAAMRCTAKQDARKTRPLIAANSQPNSDTGQASIERCYAPLSPPLFSVTFSGSPNQSGKPPHFAFAITKLHQSLPCRTFARAAWPPLMRMPTSARSHAYRQCSTRR